MPMPSPKNNFYRTLSLSSKANEEANGIGTGNSSLPLKNSQSINYTRDTPNSIGLVFIRIHFLYISPRTHRMD